MHLIAAFLLNTASGLTATALWEIYKAIPTRDWIDLYVDAFQSALKYQRPSLERFGDGTTVDVDRDALRTVLEDRLIYTENPPDSSYLELARDLNGLAQDMASKSVLVIPGHKLTDQDYGRLVQRMVDAARKRFSQLAAENDNVFRQAMLDHATSSRVGIDSILEEVQNAAGNLTTLLAMVEDLTLALGARGGKEERLTRLKRLLKKSRTRCMERWQALGLSGEKAEAWADDLQRGAPFPGLEPTSEQPIRIVSGEYGSGKSLLGDRMFQLAVRRALIEESSPIPVFLEAKKAVLDLEEAVLDACQGIGDPTSYGAYVIVDGADEAGAAASELILRQARILVGTWESTSVVITSRPSPDLTEKPDLTEERVLVEMPLLSLDEACQIVHDLAPQQEYFRIRNSVPAVIREDIRRPFFAILLAGHVKHDGLSGLTDSLDPLSSLIERALHHRFAYYNEANDILKRLAVRCIDRNGAPVHRNEVIPPAELQPLLQTRLVALEGDSLRFTLPVLAQWFAAQSLRDGRPTIEELVSDPLRMEKWFYPLTLALGDADYTYATSLLAPIAKRLPGMAGRLISGVLAKKRPSDPGDDTPPLELGRRIRECMCALSEGLSPIAPLVAPQRPDGTLRALAVARDGFQVGAIWMDPARRGDDCIETTFPGLVGCGRSIIKCPVGHHAWPWEWTFADLKIGLSGALRACALPPPPGGVLWDEAMWHTATCVAGIPENDEDGLPVAIVDEALGDLCDRPHPIVTPEGVVRAVGEESPIPLCEIREYAMGSISGPASRDSSQRLIWLPLLRRHLVCLRLRGEEYLRPPLPCRDLGPGPFVWSGYSDEQLLKLTRAVLGGAIRSYVQLVQDWFPTFAPSLNLYRILPARLMAMVLPARNSKPAILHEPRLFSYWLPLPRDEVSRVEITLAHEAETIDSEHIWEEQREALARHRPEYADQISLEHPSEPLMIFKSNPTTLRAYSWLWDDLRRIAWVEDSSGQFLI